MPSVISVFSTDVAGTSTTLILSGSGTPYSGSGTPWTSQATSPYQLSMNEVTGGIWTPTAPDTALVLSGTPPFSDGAELVYRGYANVEETIGIQMAATSYNHAVDLLNRLRRVLSPGLLTEPPVLSVQFNGATNTVVYPIVSARVQESPSFVNQEAGVTTRVIRAILTIVRRPFGASGETTVNSVASMNNSGTTSPTNLLAFGAGIGDTVSEGAPLNLNITTGTAMTRMYLGSCKSRDYSTTGAATYTTSSTSGVVSSNVVSTTLSSFAANYPAGLRLRFLVHASVAANAQFRLEVGLSASSGLPLYVSPWISSTGAVAQLIDCGGFALAAIRANPALGGSYAPSVSIRYRSTNGASASVVVTSWQFLYYYDWMVINPDYTNGISASQVVVDCYDYITPYPARAPRVYSAVTSVASNILDARGTAPRYYAGASLFCAYLTGTTGLYTPANTSQVTAYQLNQYQTLRGGTL